MTDRNIEFLYELGTLRNLQRSWRQHLGMDCANDLEHTVRVAWLALILARMEGGVDEAKLLKMALAHDIAETRTGDHNYMQKIYVDAKEDQAAADTFGGTVLDDLRTGILAEYNQRNSKEAKIVKDADNLDVDLEMKEFSNRGSQLPAKWTGTRRIVRDTKLYTASAKKLWDQIQVSDPDSWHLNSNKWYKLPDAGK